MSGYLGRRVLTISCLLVCALTFGLAQINKSGYANFKAYNAPTSSLTATYSDITQDNRGLVYLTSEQFLLQYDGSEYKMFSSEYNYYTINCEPATGILYVGGAWNFGYVEPDSIGSLEVHSLLNTLPDSVNAEDIFIDDRIFFRNDSVFFMGEGTLIVYDRKNGTSERWPLPGNARCTTIDNNIYTIKDHELCLVTRDGCIPQGTFFEDNVKFILDAERIRFDEYLLTCGYDIRVYNPYTKKTRILDLPPVSDALKERKGQVDKIQNLGYGLYAIGNRGVNKFGSFFVIDSTYHIVESFGKTAGARTNIAAGMYMSSTDSLLWTCGYDGSCVDIKSPVRRFSQLSGFSGDIADLYFFENGNPLVLTTEGVFYRVMDEQSNTVFKSIPMLESIQCLYSSNFINPFTKQKGIIISTNRGIYIVDDHYNCKKICNDPFNLVVQLSYDPTKLYATVSGSLYRLNINRDLSFTQDTTFNTLNCDYLIHDGDSILYIRDYSLLASRYNVINDELIDFEYLGRVSSMFSIKGQTDYLVAVDSLKMYEFNRETRSLEPCNLVEGIIDYNNNFAINSLSKYGKGYVSSSFNEEIAFIFPDNKGKWQYQTIPGTIRTQATQYSISPDSIVYFYSPFYVYSYKTDPDFKQLQNDIQKHETPYKTLVREVAIGDSVIFYGNFKNRFNGLSSIQPDSLIPSIEYTDKKISFKFSATSYLYENLTKYSYQLIGHDDNWSDWGDKRIAEYTNLFEGTYTFKVKSKNIYGIESSVGEYTFTITPPPYRSLWAYFIYALLFIGSVWGYSRLNAIRLSKRNIALQRIVEERTRQVRQHEASMVSNINYASRIQKAALTPSSKISEVFPKNFVIYKPHSIVSGDFYVVSEIDNKQVCVVADCTGHGVSGGFLSMLGMSIIRQIISQTLDPAEILNQLRQYVISNLHQHNEAWSIQDGMDATVYVIDKETKKLAFSGANTKLLIVRHNEIFELRGDRMPVAIHFAYTNKKYTNSYFDLESDDMVYAFTDGITDQFGGEDNGKFMITRFKNLLLEINEMGMNRQQEAILTALEAYRGNNGQTDDILVMGVRIE